MNSIVYKCTECDNNEPCIFIVVGANEVPAMCPILNEENATSTWVETKEFTVFKNL